MKTLTALLAALMALAMMTGPSVAREFSKQLSPNIVGPGYFSDGVSNEEFRGTIDTHYGVAPAWEERPEEPFTMNKHLAPNVTYGKDVN